MPENALEPAIARPDSGAEPQPLPQPERPTIDLNADLGESYGSWRAGDDAAMLERVTSANLACGFHAGDPSGLRATVRRAAAAGVAIGAHPGYPDLRGFGRRELALTPPEIADDVLYQLGALEALCRAEGAALSYVKPHGALYHRAAGDWATAAAVAGAVAAFDRRLALLSPPGSQLELVARAGGLPSFREAFIDRAYRSDGSLLPRSQPGAVIEDPEQVVARALSLAVTGRVSAADGSELELAPHSLCLHGDTAGAVELAALVRTALEEAGVSVAPFAGRGPA